MIKTSIFVFLTIFAFSSCGGAKSYTFMADHIFSSYAKTVKESKGFALAGTGGAIPRYDVRSLFMSFDVYREVDISEARKLYIETVENFVQQVNADLKIRPYLRDFPFTWKNADIKLGFYDPTNQREKNGHIAYVSKINNIIFYSIFDEKKDCLETVFRKPYEEALRIVRGESVPNTNNTTLENSP